MSRELWQEALVALPPVVDPQPARKRKPARRQEHDHELGPGLTDTGNAKRFAARHGKDVRYHAARGEMVYDDKRWRPDPSGWMPRAKETALSWSADAGELLRKASEVEDDVERSALQTRARRLSDHGRRSEQAPRLNAMVQLSRSEPRIFVEDIAAFDSKPMLFNAGNGTVDLETGKLRPHAREDMLTRLSDVPYIPDAKAPVWGAAFHRWLGGRQDLMEFVRLAIGYSLTGLTVEQCLLFLFGPGANGKTSLIEAVRGIAGEYAVQSDFATFAAKDTDGITNDLARLAAARIVMVSEIEAGRRLAEVRVKQFTGGDAISARYLYREPFEFKPEGKLWFAANHKPTIRGTDEGIWRRMRLIPFNVTIPADERDPHLAAKLSAEAPGILAWAVRAALDWSRDGLKPPSDVLAATRGYRQEMDVLGTFIADRCVEHERASAQAAHLHGAFKEWARENGEHEISVRALGLRLGERGYTKETSGFVMWRGIGLRSEDGPCG